VLPPSTSILFAGTALLLASALSAQSTNEGPYPVSPKRPSFSVSTSVVPGSSLELELGFDAADGQLTLPTDLRFGLDGFLKRTELSVAYDSIDVQGSDPRFGEKLTVGLRTRFLDPASGPSVAFAPEVGIGLREGVSDTLGALLIADRSFGRHGIVGNLKLEAPIDQPEGAPSHTFTWILGYSLVFGQDGRFGAFAEVLQDLPQGQGDTVSFIQGVSFAVHPYFVIDLAVQQTGVGSDSTTWEVLGGLTRNFGKPF